MEFYPVLKGIKMGAKCEFLKTSPGKWSNLVFDTDLFNIDRNYYVNEMASFEQGGSNGVRDNQCVCKSVAIRPLGDFHEQMTHMTGSG